MNKKLLKLLGGFSKAKSPQISKQDTPTSDLTQEEKQLVQTALLNYEKMLQNKANYSICEEQRDYWLKKAREIEKLSIKLNDGKNIILSFESEV